MRIQIDQPLLRPGCFIGLVDDVIVIYTESDLDDATYAEYIATITAELDHSADGERRGLMYDVVKGGSTTAARRKQLGELISSRRDKIRKLFAGCAFASESPLARGIATAICWLVPPPVETTFVKSTREAFDWLGERVPLANTADTLARYELLKQRYLPRIR